MQKVFFKRSVISDITKQEERRLFSLTKVITTLLQVQ